MSFGERLFHYYLLEMFPLKSQGSLLELFYQQTGEKREHWANVFKDNRKYACRVLENT